MTRPQLQRPPRGLRVGLVIALLGLLAASCSGGADTAATGDPSVLPDVAGCRSPQTGSDAELAGSFEDANLLVGGEMFRIYGAGADPVREQVTGDVVMIDGVLAWKLDAVVAVTVDGQRRTDSWMLWVGVADWSLAMLCAVGPDTVAWPPR